MQAGFVALVLPHNAFHDENSVFRVG